jgi:tetratricopeptide (TPR) repeat protein
MAVAADPEDPDGYYLLGFALQRLDRHAEALAAVDSGLAKAPGWHDLHVLRSDALRDLRRPLDALQAGEEAVRLAPNLPDGYAALALSAAALGNHSDAIISLRRALELAPDSSHLHRLLADQCLSLSDYEAAISHYLGALGLEPNDANTLNNLGCAFLRSGRSEEAALAFKSAVMVDPTLKLAKQNMHATMRGIVKGASVLGVLAIIAIKFKLLWIFFLARNLLTIPWVWLVLAIALAIAVAVAKLRGQRRMQRLTRKDPQLLALYQRLKADRRAGRI